MDYGYNSMTPADFAAVVGNRGGFGGGYGGYGGYDIMWIVLFMFFAMNGGWGNNGWGNGNRGYGGNGVYDISADMQRGFNQQATQSTLASLQSQIGNGFADAAVAQCQGNANITAAITNGQYATSQAITGAKDTISQNLNQLAMSLQNCCCENRAGLADLKYTVATEACADRQAVSDGLRDVIANQTANTQALINSQNAGFQSIQDKLCQLELDSYKQKVSDQASEIAALKGAISQTAQTAQLIQDNNLQTQTLINRINPAPIPAYTVPNPNTGCCGGNYYGCGCAA